MVSQMKRRSLLSAISLILCVFMLAPMLFACGEGSTEATTDGGAATEGNVEEATTPEPTPEPTTPEPTEPPTTYEPIDPSLPYFEQMDIEFERFGFHDGGDVLTLEPADEKAVLDKMATNGSIKKEALDVSGDDVPFTAAYTYDITAEAANFWDINVTGQFASDLTFTAGEIIAGVVWVRNAGGENPGQCYFAIKSPTDEWATEGAMNLNIYEATDEWEKVYFYGEVINDEPVGINIQFQMFMGYGPMKLDVGGLYIKRYSADQFKATLNMPY